MLRTIAPARLARGMAAMLLGVGTVHFLALKQFDEIIPPAIPIDPRTLTYASGVAEIAVGTGLLLPATRKPAAAAAAALFVAVFPANIYMARLWWDKPLAYRVVALARLPLQIPMIAAAIKVYRGS